MGPLVVWWPRYHASLWYIDYCTHILSHWHFGVAFACVMIIESGTCYWSPTPPNYRNVFPSPCIMWAAIMSAGVSTKKGQCFPLLSWNNGMLSMSSYILIDLRYITVHYISLCLNVSVSQMPYGYDSMENSVIYSWVFNMYRRIYKSHLMVIMEMRVVLSDAYWNMIFLLMKWNFELLTLSVLLEFQYCNINVFIWILTVFSLQFSPCCYHICGIYCFVISARVRVLHVLIPYVRDDVIKWKHVPRYWPFVQGIHRWPVNSPHQVQWRGALMFPLIFAWTNSWVNTRDASDLRCHHAHYDVTAMV